MFSVFFRDMFFHPLLNMRWRNPNCTFIFPSRFLVSFLLNLQHSQMLSGFADISPGSKILSRVFVSYCWWFRNPANQLFWAISHYLPGFYTSQVVVWDFFHQQYWNNLSCYLLWFSSRALTYRYLTNVHQARFVVCRNGWRTKLYTLED